MHYSDQARKQIPLKADMTHFVSKATENGVTVDQVYNHGMRQEPNAVQNNFVADWEDIMTLAPPATRYFMDMPPEVMCEATETTVINDSRNAEDPPYHVAAGFNILAWEQVGDEAEGLFGIYRRRITYYISKHVVPGSWRQLYDTYLVTNGKDYKSYPYGVAWARQYLPSHVKDTSPLQYIVKDGVIAPLFLIDEADWCRFITELPITQDYVVYRRAPMIFLMHILRLWLGIDNRYIAVFAPPRGGQFFNGTNGWVNWPCSFIFESLLHRRPSSAAHECASPAATGQSVSPNATPAATCQSVSASQVKKTPWNSRYTSHGSFNVFAWHGKVRNQPPDFNQDDRLESIETVYSDGSQRSARDVACQADCIPMSKLQPSAQTSIWRTTTNWCERKCVARDGKHHRDSYWNRNDNAIITRQNSCIAEPDTVAQSAANAAAYKVKREFQRRYVDEPFVRINRMEAIALHNLVWTTTMTKHANEPAEYSIDFGKYHEPTVPRGIKTENPAWFAFPPEVAAQAKDHSAQPRSKDFLPHNLIGEYLCRHPEMAKFAHYDDPQRPARYGNWWWRTSYNKWVVEDPAQTSRQWLNPPWSYHLTPKDRVASSAPQLSKQTRAIPPEWSGVPFNNPKARLIAKDPKFGIYGWWDTIAGSGMNFAVPQNHIQDCNNKRRAHVIKPTEQASAVVQPESINIQSSAQFNLTGKRRRESPRDPGTSASSSSSAPASSQAA